MPLPEWLKQGDQDEAPSEKAPKQDTAPADEQSEPLQPPPSTQPQEPDVQAETEPDVQVEVEIEAEPSEPDTVSAPAEATDPKTDQRAEGDEVLGMLAAIEKQLAQLGDTQEKHAQRLESINEPQGGGPLDEKDASGDQDDRPTMADLEQREAELHAMRKRMEELETQLRAALQASDDAESLQRQLNESQTEIEDLVRQAQSTHAELQEKTQQIEQAGQQLETLQSQIEPLKQELEQAQSQSQVQPVVSVETDVDEEQVAALNEQIAQLSEEICRRDETIQGLESSPGAPSGVSVSDSESGGGGGASQELLERQRQQIERLTEQLTVLQVDASPVEIQERDARIAELEDQMREQGAGMQGMSKRMAGLGGALSRGKKGKASKASSIDALEFRLEELMAERETLKDEVNQLKSTMKSGGVTEGDGAEVANLKTRVAELEGELEAVGDADGSDDAARKLRKELAEAKADAKQAEIDTRQATELQAEVQRLKQAMSARRRTPKNSIGTTGRQRTVVVFGSLVGMAIAAVIFSGVLANKIAPATMSASVNIEAKSRLGGTVNDVNAALWEQWHREKLQKDVAFHEKVARRLRDQRLDQFNTAEAVTDRLAADLTIDSPRPGMLKLTLAGTDRHDLGTILDTVATTLAIESSHQAGKRSDGAIAVVRGERQQGGRILYASLNPTPIKDRRLIVGIFFFVLCFVGGVFAMNKIYRGVRGTREAMDEDPYESVAAEG